ncbi:MAG: PKD domain-containing protein [Marinilabiliales bacterium]|nr:MAG: PKD domain-containing protein [Marinilabiliales bacterium]
MHRILPIIVLLVLKVSLLYGQADHMVVSMQPQNTLQERTIGGPPTVTLYDESDNPVVGVNITATINKNSFAGGSTLTVETNEQGEAIFTNLIIDDFDTGYEITFEADNDEAPGVADVTSVSFEIYEEQFTITILNQPIHSVADHTLEAADIINPVTVRVADMEDNPVASGTVYVTLNEGDFTVESTTSASVSGGIAIFDNLIIDEDDTGYQLIFSNPSVHIADVTSDAFDLAAEIATMSMYVNTSESIEGIPIYGPPTVYVDDDGSPVVGELITAYLNKNDFSGGSTTTATTNGDGLAIFDDLIIDDYTTGYQIFFKATTQGIATITSDLFDVVQEVALLEVTLQPELTIADELINGPPTVTLKEKGTNDPLLANILVTLNHGSFKDGSTTIVTTVDGVAVFNNLRIDTPGDYMMIFSVPGTSGVDTVMTAEFEVLAIAGNMTVTTQPLETIEGYMVEGPPTVTILDTESEGIEGLVVTAILNQNEFSSDPATQEQTTDANGVAVFDALVIDEIAGNYTIFFDLPVTSGVVGETSESFDVVEEVALLSINQQPTLTIAGETINGPPSVLIINKATSNPIPSINIYVSLNKGDFQGGSTTMATTNASGIATFDNLIIEDDETGYQLVFSSQSPGVADISSGLFDVIPVEGAITITQQPLETVDGYAVAGPPAIQVLDNDTNPMEDIGVTAVINKNSIASGTETRLTNDQGMAVFDDLVLSDIATGYELTFTVDVGEGIPDKTSEAFRVVAEVAVIEITQEPLLTIGGELVNGPPTVLLRTPGGDPITGGNITVYLNKNDFAGGSTTTVTTNASGIAVFDNLIIDDADTGYQLTFSSGSSGIADRTSGAFDVVEPLGLMTITQHPLETVDGHPVAGPPTVTITETNSEPWEGDEVTVTVSVNKNDFSSGTLSRETVDGVAVFNDLVLNAIDTGYELVFSIDISEHIANKTSDPFNVVAVAGYLDITTQPSETVAGDPINGPPVVRLTNLSGQGVAGVTISAALNKNSFNPGSTLTAVTNSTGHATFGNLVIDDHDTGYNLTFTAVGASGVAAVTSNDFEVTDATLSMDIVEQPTETVAGVAMVPAPRVHVYNGGGNMEGVVVTAYINMNSFSGSSTVTATTDAGGIATFDNLIINTADAGYLITFNADLSGVPNAHSAAFTIIPAAAGYILVTTHPQNTTAGETITGPPAATAYDEFGNPVPGISIGAEPNQNPGSFSGTTPVTTDAGGVAVFDDLVITTSASNYQLFFTSAGVTTGNSGTFAINNAAPDHITIITQPSETVAGAAISGPPVIAVEDQYGNPVQGETVTISTVEGYAIDAGTLSLETPANGVVAFPDLVINTVGTYSFRFAVDGLEATSAYFSVVQGTLFSRFFGASHSGFVSSAESGIPLGQTPARIEVITQPMESIVGTGIAGPPRVVVYDAVDNPVPGVSVTVTGAPFSAGIETLYTGNSGEAAFGGLVIDAAGTYTLTFTADDHPDVFTNSDPFDVIDPTATMTMSMQPQQTVAGEAVAGHPTVLLLNSIGMPVPDVDITVYINQHNFGGGSVITVTTGADGLAGFDELFLTSAAPGYQLIYDADYSGVLNIISDPFSVVSAPAHSIGVTTQPLETLEGATLAGPPAVTIYDEYGNTVAGIPVTVTEAIQGIPFDAGITTLTTNSSGVASFSTLVLNTRGTYQLSFGASGVPSVTSGTFQVVSGTVANRFRGNSHSGFTSLLTQDKLLGQTPTRLEITTQPAETVAGFIVEGLPAVRIYDEIDNPVAGVQVTVSVLDGGSFSEGTTTRTTNEQGDITFNDLVISDQGTYRLNFSADNHTATVSDVQSVPFDVTGQFYFMDIVTQPGNSIAGEAVAGPPVVNITNYIYQPLAGVDVTVYINQHGFASGSYTVPTNMDGEAVFEDLVINTAAMGYQLIFDADYPGIANETSVTFEVSNAPPSNISITTQPGTTIEGAVIVGPPSVRLADEFGNPVAGETIYVAETGGYSFDAGSTFLLTDASGSAVFSDLIINNMGQYSLTFSADGVDDAISMNFNVTSGTVANRFYGNTHSGFVSFEAKDKALGQIPARIEIVTQPQETVLGDFAGVSGPPAIRVYDEVDNPMGGVWVNVSTGGAGITDGETLLVSEADGTISYPGLMIDEIGSYQLTFIAQDYPAVSATSAIFEVVGPNLFMTMDTQPAETVAGQPVAGQPTVKLANAIGQGFEGVDVTVVVNQHSFASEPATLTVTTDADGLALFDELILNTAATGYQLIFDADYPGVVNLASDAFTVIPAGPDAISIIQQPADTDAGSVIAGPPSVRVTDEFGNVIPGVGVSVAETGGYIFDGGNTSQNTNASGVASFTDLVIDNQGQYSLTFSSAGVDDAVSTIFNVLSGTVSNRFKGSSHSGFNTTAIDDVRLGQQPTRIEILMQPQETISGDAIAGPPLVVLYDEVDNPVGGITINVYIAGAGGPLFSGGSTTQVITDTNGEAEFDNLIVELTGTFTLRFEADGYDGIVPDAISQPFDVVDPLLTMEITGQPAETIAGQVITGPPAVRLTTAGAVQQPFAGVGVTVYINQNSFASGTQTVMTNDQGYAIFDDLVIETAAAGYQIIFDADYSGVTNQISGAFIVLPGPASQMNMVTQPLNAQAGEIIGGPPTIALYDAYNNPVQGVAITLTEQGGYSFDGGTTIQTTGPNGYASFSDLLINTTGYYTLNFDAAAGGVPDIQSQQFRILSNDLVGRFRGASHSGFTQEEEKDVLLKQIPTYIDILTHPSQTVSGEAVQGHPRVAVYDQLYQPVFNADVMVSVVGGTVPAMTGTMNRQTDGDGEVVFDDLVISEIIEHRLYFEVGGHNHVNVTSQYFEVIAPLLTMAIHTEPADTQAGEIIEGDPSGHPAVIITDGLGNGADNIEVSVYLNRFAFASDPVFATVTTNESGVAVFDNLSITHAAANYQMLFEASSAGVNSVTSGSFTILPAPPHTLTISTQPQSSFAGAAIEGPPAAALHDEFNNPIEGATVTVGEAGSEPLGGTTSVITNSGGTAIFSNITIDTPGTYQLVFDNADVDPVTSFSFTVSSSEIAGRFRGSTHSGFTSELIEDVPLYIPDPVEAPLFDDPATEMCEGTTETFTATAEHSDSLKYSINPPSFGTMNENTGELVLNMGFYGTLYVIATAYGHEGPVSDSVVVTVNSEVDIPQFDDPVYTVCQGVDLTTQYIAETVQGSIISYSAEPVEAGSINTITGIMTWAPGFSGEARIYAHAEATNGCGPVKDNFVTVTVNPEIGDPLFIQGAVELCQDAPNETYQAASTNAESITYSLSDGAAGTLNPTTGVMNWDAGFHGQVTITATATGCGGPKTVNRVVTVHPAPATSAITGNSPVVCNAEGEVYSVVLNPGSSYQWTVPAGATIISGADGPENNSITVDFGENNGNITVIETSVHGCTGALVSLMVTLDGCGMQADFESTATTVCEGGSITFTDLSTNPVSWTWDFGPSASPSGATTQGPHTVTFNTEGIYTVTLTVTDGVASDTHEIQVTVQRRGRWLGTVDTDWFNTGNWSCGVLPDQNTDVTIESGADHDPEISGSDASVRNITIEDGATLGIDGVTLNVYGNWTNNGTFTSGGTVAFRGSPSTITGTSETIFNNILITSGAALSAPANLYIEGNLVVDGTYTHNNGRVVFTGGSGQQISGSSATLVLHTLETDKTSNSLTIDRNVDIASQLNLVNGIIHTSTGTMLRLQAGSSSTDGSDGSHVDGPIEKRGGTAFIFPTGNNGVWAPIGISAPGAPDETFVAQYFHEGHPESAVPDTDGPCSNCVTDDSIRVVLDTEYWTLNRTGGSSSPDVTMYFKDLDRSGISSLATLVYAHWDGAEWSKKGKGGISDEVNMGYITGTGFSSYNVHAPAIAIVEDECSAVITRESPPVEDIICEDDVFELRVEFTGEAPFRLIYTDGDGNDVTLENINDNYLIIEIVAEWHPPDPLGPVYVYQYTIVEVEDANGCKTEGEGTVTIEVYKRPTTGPVHHIPNTFGQ